MRSIRSGLNKIRVSKSDSTSSQNMFLACQSPWWPRSDLFHVMWMQRHLLSCASILRKLFGQHGREIQGGIKANNQLFGRGFQKWGRKQIVHLFKLIWGRESRLPGRVAWHHGTLHHRCMAQYMAVENFRVEECWDEAGQRSCFLGQARWRASSLGFHTYICFKRILCTSTSQQPTKLCWQEHGTSLGSEQIAPVKFNKSAFLNATANCRYFSWKHWSVLCVVCERDSRHSFSPKSSLQPWFWPNHKLNIEGWTRTLLFDNAILHKAEI